MNEFWYILGSIPLVLILYFLLVRLGFTAYFKSKIEYIRSLKEIEKKEGS